MRRSVRGVVAALVAVALASGCGGGSGKKSSAPPSDPRSAGQLAADKAEAQRLVLRLPDLPAGWTSKPGTASARAQQAATRERYTTCLGEDPSFNGARDRSGAESEEFEDNDDHRVSNAVTIWHSHERGLGELDSSRKPSARGCYETAVNAAIQESVKNPPPDDPPPPGVSFGQVKVEELKVFGLHADSVALRVKLPISAEGQTANAIFDVVLALKGRVTIDLTVQSLEKPFSPALETTLINKVIDRTPGA